MKEWAEHHRPASSKRNNKRQSRRSSTSCQKKRRQNLEHGASFLFQIAVRKVQPLQFLMNQYSCLRHLTVRLSLLSVTRKLPKSSSPLRLNLSRSCQEPITRSEQLPYSVCATAFSQVGLFLDSLSRELVFKSQSEANA